MNNEENIVEFEVQSAVEHTEGAEGYSNTDSSVSDSYDSSSNSGVYSDTTNHNNSGDYDDLVNKPIIFYNLLWELIIKKHMQHNNY